MTTAERRTPPPTTSPDQHDEREVLQYTRNVVCIVEAPADYDHDPTALIIVPSWRPNQPFAYPIDRSKLSAVGLELAPDVRFFAFMNPEAEDLEGLGLHLSPYEAPDVIIESGENNVPAN